MPRKTETKTTVKTEKVAEAKVVKPQIFPIATEKAYAEQTKNTYIFRVPLNAEKLAVQRAIEGQFNVTITSIRTLVRKGKPTRFSRGKHAYPGTTFRQDKKFAYITLKDGDKIPGIFADEEAEEPAKDAKKDKKEKEKGGDK